MYRYCICTTLLVLLTIIRICDTSLSPTITPSVKPSLCPSIKPSIVPSVLPSIKPSLIPSTSPTFSMIPSVRPTITPSQTPTILPTQNPSVGPSISPTEQPTVFPSIEPSHTPTMEPSTPTSQPSGWPTSCPSSQPSGFPSAQPSNPPTGLPTAQPSHMPSNQPSSKPSIPTSQPSAKPSRQPSSLPTMQPSRQPTSQPSARPSRQPSSQPSVQPASKPSRQPTRQPTGQPSRQPSRQPTRQPTSQPSSHPTKQPFSHPSGRPSCQPQGAPSAQPFSFPTGKPSFQPTIQPSSRPSYEGETRHPSASPTSSRPTSQPSEQPSCSPTGCPSSQPSSQPSLQPVAPPTGMPSAQPSGRPTCVPVPLPTSLPSRQPTRQPSGQPTRVPTTQPTGQPNRRPTSQPTRQPFMRPSSQPSRHPTSQPTRQPYMRPSGQPSRMPTTQPTGQPSRAPSSQPTRQPSRRPSSQPTRQPSMQPSSQPSRHPTCQPTRRPSTQPTGQPSRHPTQQPFARPSSKPSQQPTSHPSMQPSEQPTSLPTLQPFMKPSGVPSQQPFAAPTGDPSSQPSTQPTLQPFSPPTGKPTQQPSSHPSQQPSASPTSQPSSQPSSRPSNQPSRCPTRQPSSQPSRQPTVQPTRQPTRQPSGQPTTRPTTSVPTSSAPFRGPVRTHRPTQSPSVYPTSCPSGEPTASPSTSVASVWVDKMGTLLHSLSANDSRSGVAARVNYYELTVNKTRLLGGCQHWESFQQGELLSNTVLLSVNSISFSVLRSAAGPYPPSYSRGVLSNTSTHTCSNPRNASLLVNHINGQVNRNVSVQCDSHLWKVKYCPLVGNNNRHSLAVCVDCDNPCDVFSQCPSSFPNEPSTLRSIFTALPCFNGYLQCYQPYTAYSVGHAISVSFKDSQPLPSIVASSLVLGRTSVQVSLSLDGSGSVFCAAFAGASPSEYDYVPSSVQNVIALNQASATVAAVSGGYSNATLSIGGLTGAARYNLYCVSMSSSGNTQTYQSVLQSKQTFTTLCCKQISLRTTASHYYQNTINTGALLVSLDSKPRDYAVATFYGVNVLTGIAENIFNPRQIVLSVTSPYVAGLEYSLSVKSYLKGTYNVTCVVSGPDSTQYSVAYSKSRLISILDVLNPPPAPVLLRALVSNDLSSVLVEFDTPTNKAGAVKDFFICSKLLTFTHSNTTTCQWSADADTVTILLTGNAPLALTDSIILLGGQVRAVCSKNSFGCDGWDATPSQSVRLTAPLLPVVPSVALSVPSSIGKCENLTLDLTASSGSGGRVWSRVRVNVTSRLQSESSAAALEAFFASLSPQSFTSAVVVPAAYLEAGSFYLLSVTLCNFASVCGSAAARVVVLNSIVPSVTIFGGNLRTVSRSSPLSLTSLSSLTYCSDAGDTNIRGKGGSVTSDGVSHVWSVSVNGAESISLVSQSNDPSKFMLPSFSLSVGSVYEVVLTSSFDRYFVSASSSVNVLVKQGDIKAQISGGAVRFLANADIITLDASSSFDSDWDSSGLGGTALLFTWGCNQVSPVLLTYCTLGVITGVYSKTPFQSLQAGGQLNCTNTVTVTVTDPKNARMSQASVNIVAVNSSATQLSLTSSASRFTMNPSDQLTLTANVVKHSRFPSTVSLSSSDASVSLSSASLLSLSHTLTSSTVFTFVIRPFSLSAGTLNTLTVSSRDSDSGLTLSTSITVAVNAAPRSGSLQVSPRVGTELSSVFSLLTLNWFDSDLPLTYQFAIRTAAGASLAIQERSQVSLTSSLLPAGAKSLNYSLTCEVQVFDGLNANTSSFDRVVVRSQSLFRNVTLERLSLEALLRPNNNSANTLLSSSAVTLFLLNDIDCSKAPNCSKLNRYDCAGGQLPNTCGSCLSSGFLGSGSPSNSACITPADYLHMLNTTSLRGVLKCNTTANCSGASGLPWQECHLGVCRVAQQQCASNCSSHGSCVMQSSTNSSLVAYCPTGASWCRPVCECRSGYWGEACSYSTQQYAARSELRQKLSVGLLALSRIIDPSDDSLYSAASVLKELAAFSDELDTQSLANIVNSAANLIGSVRLHQQNGRYETVSDAVAALDGVISAQVNSYAGAFSTISTGRRLLTTTTLRVNDSLNAQLINTTEHALQLYGQIVSASMAPDQQAVQLIATNFRAVSYSFAAVGVTRAVSVVAPLTFTEVYENNTAASRVKLQQVASSVGLRVSAVLWSNKWFGNGQFQSDSLQLHVDSVLPCDSSAARVDDRCAIEAEFVLRNHKPLDFSDRAPAFYHDICEYDDFKVHQYRCASGLLVNASCNGSFVELASRCDYIQPMGVCNSVVGLRGDLMNNGCNVSHYDSLSTTCVCPIIGAPPQTARRLGVGESEELWENVTRLSGGGSGHFVSSINFQYIPYVIEHLDFIPDTSQNKSSWRVQITVGSLLLAMLMCVSIAYRNDYLVAKEKSANDKITARYSLFFRSRQQTTTAVVPEPPVMRRSRSIPIGAPNVSKPETKKVVPGSTSRISTADLKAVLLEERKYQECPEMRIVDQALPHVFRSSSYQHRAESEMKQFHRYLNLLFVDSKFYSRMFRVLSLTSTLISFLFMLSVVYSEVDPNDGYCENRTNEQDCTAELDPFGTGYTRCYWDEGFKLGSCHFNQPTHNLKIVLFVTVFSVIASSPLAFMMDYTIQHTLAVPTKKFSKLAQVAAKNSTKTNVNRHTAAAAGGPRGQNSRATAQNVAQKPASQSLALKPPNQLQPLTKAPTQLQRTNSSLKPGQPLNMTAASSPRGSETNRKRTESKEHLNTLLQEAEQRNSLGARRVVNNPFNLLLSVQNVAISTEKEDITSLLTSLREFREKLSGKRKKIFDDRWGLEAKGGFVIHKQKHSWFNAGSIDVLKLITNDLKKTRYELTKEIFTFKKHLTHAADRKKRILFLFLKDLMYGLNAQILEQKQNREVLYTKPILASSKVKGWLFVLGLDTGMLVYIYYFSLQQSTARQNAWFKSLLLWVVMDCLFVSTLVTYISHLYVPMLIKRKVAQAKAKLIECMKEFNKRAARAASVAAALSAFNDINGGSAASPLAGMRAIQEDDSDEDEDDSFDPDNPSDLEAGSSGRAAKKWHKIRSLFNQKNVDEDSRFNTARTLFLSYRLAEEFLEYRESRIVTSFVAIWPIKSYLPKKVVEAPFASLTLWGKCERCALRMSQWSARVAAFSLSLFLLFPVVFQDFVVYVAVFVLFGAWMLFHLFLYDIYPAYALIPSFVTVVVIHFVVVSSNASSGDNLASDLNVNEDQDFDEIDDSELEAANIEKLKSEDDQAAVEDLVGSMQGSFSIDPADSDLPSRQRRVANVLKPKADSAEINRAPAAASRVTMLSTVDRISSQYIRDDDDLAEESRQPEPAAPLSVSSNVKGRTLAPSQLEALRAIRDKSNNINEEEEEAEEEEGNYKEPVDTLIDLDRDSTLSPAAQKKKEYIPREGVSQKFYPSSEEAKQLSSSEQRAIDWVQSVLAAASGGKSLDVIDSPNYKSPSFRLSAAATGAAAVPHSPSEDVRDAAALASSRFPSIGSSFDFSQYSPKAAVKAPSITSTVGPQSRPSGGAAADWALSSFQAFSQKQSGFNVSSRHSDSDSEDDEEAAREDKHTSSVPAAVVDVKAVESVEPLTSPPAAASAKSSLTAASLGLLPVDSSPRTSSNFLLNSNYTLFNESSASIKRDNQAARAVSSIMLSSPRPAAGKTNNNNNSSFSSPKMTNPNNNSSNVSAKQKAKNQNKAADRLSRGL